MSVEIRQITKLFGKQIALNDVSFSINKGELVGFLGPNGAGKSTLMKIITGFLSADAGEVFVEGEKTGPKNLEIRKNIGYLPEHNPLYTDLYVREFLEITAGLYQLKNVKNRVPEMVELTGLGDEQHKKIRALSKGYRQRVGLAQALIHNPPVLILDEPTTGLDPNQIGEIRQLISNISREKTVMISSHIMQEVEAICNRVIIINHGKIVADGGIDEIRNFSLNRQPLVIAEFTSAVNPEKILELQGVKQVIVNNNCYEIEPDGTIDIRPSVFQFAVDNQLTLITLHEKQQTLENVFQNVTR